MKKTSNHRNKFRVFILDASDLVRRTLAQLLEHELDLTVCGEAATVEAALEKIHSARPDVAVVNLDPLNTAGPSVLGGLRWKFPDLPFLVLSLHKEAIQGRRMLQVGAAGYISQAEAARQVVPALRNVLRGGVFRGYPSKQAVRRGTVRRSVNSKRSTS